MIDNPRYQEFTDNQGRRHRSVIGAGIDRERLHLVLTGQLKGRGVGHTYAKCWQLTKLVQAHISPITVVISEQHSMNYIFPMLEEVCEEESIVLSRKEQNNILMNGIKVVFINDREYRSKTSQWLNFTTIWMRDNDEAFQARPVKPFPLNNTEDGYSHKFIV